MKIKKVMAFLLAAATVLCAASCNDDDDEEGLDEIPKHEKTVTPADAIAGCYVDSLSYTVGTMSSGTIQNDTLTISKVEGKDNMVDLHFSQYMGMGGKSSSLNIYNVVVTEKDGKYTLSVSDDSNAATKAKMTSSSYEVSKIEATVSDKDISLDFDFVIAAMNATFSNEFKNGVKVSK
ncbi:MAG: hypothetical protein J5875_03990 [Paludibacteraceae bacterium]|nr:hypothetical protein [Paludibacteraceae bacterium]